MGSRVLPIDVLQNSEFVEVRPSHGALIGACAIVAVALAAALLTVRLPAIALRSAHVSSVSLEISLKQPHAVADEEAKPIAEPRNEPAKQIAEQPPSDPSRSTNRSTERITGETDSNRFRTKEPEHDFRALLESAASATIETHHNEYQGFDGKPNNFAEWAGQAQRAAGDRAIWENVETDQLGRKVLRNGGCFRVIEDNNVMRIDIFETFTRYIVFCDKDESEANFIDMRDFALIPDAAK